MSENRSAAAAARVKAGESPTKVARELGITREAIYGFMNREHKRAEKAEASRAAVAQREQSEKDRLAHAIADELAARRWSVIELPREYGPDGADWVRLSEVLRVLG